MTSQRSGSGLGVAAAVDDGRWRRDWRAGRRWAAWGAALGISLGLLTQLPAQWLADGLNQASDGRLLLAEARGSLWQGSGTLVLTGGSGSRDAAVLPDRLHWQLRPSWHGLQLQASQACCLPSGLRLQLQPAWGGFSLQLGDGPPAPGAASAAPAALIGHWPAAWLTGLGTPWNTLQLGGQLQLNSAGLRLQSADGRLQLQGSLNLLLQDVSSSLSTLPALGSYKLRLQGNDGQPTTLQLSTVEGALRLRGDGQWRNARLHFRGVAQAAEGQDSVLSNLLNIIGQRQGALSILSIG